MRAKESALSTTAVRAGGRWRRSGRRGFHAGAVKRCAALALHARTRAQGYSGQADWDAIGRAAELAQETPTLILGNGDVTSRSDAEARAATYGLDGVLIGRASFGNPFIFHLDHQPFTDPKDRRERMAFRYRLMGMPVGSFIDRSTSICDSKLRLVTQEIKRRI